MARLLMLVLFVSVHLFKDCGSFRWEEGGLKSGTRVVQCSGLTVTFPWQYSLDEGDQLVGLSWSYRSSQSVGETNIGVFALDEFSPKDDRLSKVGTAGIQISNVSSSDSGIFIVYAQLSGRGSADFQNATLLVAEPPTTVQGRLQVSVNDFPPEGSTDEVTMGSGGQPPAVSGEGVQRLMCGQFQHLGIPPVSVVWEDPDGHLLPSASHERGYFILDLPEESKGGSYKCLLNLSSEAVGCLPGDSALREKAEVQISKRAASVAASLSGGVIAAIIIAILVIVLIVIVVLVVVIFRRRKGKSYAPKEPDSPGPEEEEASHPFNKVL